MIPKQMVVVLIHENELAIIIQLHLIPQTINEIGCFYVFVKAGTNAYNIYLCLTNNLFIDCREKIIGCNKMLYFYNINYNIIIYINEYKY